MCVPQCGQRDSAFCETDLLHEVLETEAASSLVAESDRLHDVSECMAVFSLVAETVRLPAVLECLAATDQLHTESESSGARVCLFGHSAWRSRVRGLRLRREAHGRSVSFVENSSSSSHHVDRVHTRSVGCAHGEHDLLDARTNSCLGTHAARVNSFCLHSACDNSGVHVNLDGCTHNSCCGVGGGTKPMSRWGVLLCFSAAGVRKFA